MIEKSSGCFKNSLNLLRWRKEINLFAGKKLGRKKNSTNPFALC